jgi:hypothetical protein
MNTYKGCNVVAVSSEGVAQPDVILQGVHIKQPFCKRKPLLSIRQLKKKKPWINNYILDQIHGEKEIIGISQASVI